MLHCHGLISITVAFNKHVPYPHHINVGQSLWLLVTQSLIGDKVNGQITWYIGYGDLSYTGNPYNGYMNPYRWGDNQPLSGEIIRVLTIAHMIDRSVIYISAILVTERKKHCYCFAGPHIFPHVFQTHDLFSPNKHQSLCSAIANNV